MGKKVFNPYAKGIPEKKAFPSRYDSVRETTGSNGPKTPGQRPPSSPSQGASVPGDRPRTAMDPTVRPPAGHASTRVPGAGDRPVAPPVDRDLLDGLEGNHRRQRGWGDDSKPDELVDGISITPISKEELKKKLAAQKSGGFLGGKNL